MQDYAKQLLSAINQYDADNPESVIIVLLGEYFI